MAKKKRAGEEVLKQKLLSFGKHYKKTCIAGAIFIFIAAFKTEFLGLAVLFFIILLTLFLKFDRVETPKTKIQKGKNKWFSWGWFWFWFIFGGGIGGIIYLMVKLGDKQ